MLLHRKDKRCPEQMKTKIGTGEKKKGGQKQTMKTKENAVSK